MTKEIQNPLLNRKSEASVTHTISELCENCPLCLTPLSTQDEDEFSPNRSPLYRLHRQWSDIFADFADAIKYKDGTMEPVWWNLTFYIDYWLVAYFHLQYDLLDGKTVRLPESISSAIELQCKKSPNDRKRMIFPLPRSKVKISNKIIRTCPEFAFNAQMLLFAQRLFMRRDATNALFSPEHVCCFLPYAAHNALISLDKSLSSDSSDPKKLSENRAKSFLYPRESFTLEDYILFERATACSFFIEVSAALLCVEPEIQEVCLDILTDEPNFRLFLSSPFLLSRIAVARQFVFESASQIKRQFWNTSLTGEDLKREQLRTAQRIMDFLYNIWMFPSSEPNCAGIKNPQKEITALQNVCAKKLLEQINGITAPINFAAYVEAPIYGPIAFCNPKHRNVETLLNDVRYFNSAPQKPRQNPGRGWEIFSRLCKADEIISFGSIEN